MNDSVRHSHTTYAPRRATPSAIHSPLAQKAAAVTVALPRDMVCTSETSSLSASASAASPLPKRAAMRDASYTQNSPDRWPVTSACVAVENATQVTRDVEPPKVYCARRTTGRRPSSLSSPSSGSASGTPVSGCSCCGGGSDQTNRAPSVPSVATSSAPASTSEPSAARKKKAEATGERCPTKTAVGVSDGVPAFSKLSSVCTLVGASYRRTAPSAEMTNKRRLQGDQIMRRMVAADGRAVAIRRNGE
mmetsp:Transcript_7723/g.24762  ORF Transcript_7723/g.24762 Transcript_7723/m.24762 type:complete len:248 (+) Transcript_7723:1824-2567(+)